MSPNHTQLMAELRARRLEIELLLSSMELVDGIQDSGDYALAKVQLLAGFSSAGRAVLSIEPSIAKRRLAA